MISESVSHAGAAASIMMVSPSVRLVEGCRPGAGVLRPRRRRQYRHVRSRLLLSGREQVRDNELPVG
jgi:hypothetical protein